MSSRFHIIPDIKEIEENLILCREWNLAFEYNDFFNPQLLDDPAELEKRIEFYRALDRDRSEDTLHGAFYDICVNSTDLRIAEISKDRMRQSMEIASRLGSKGVVFHSSLIPGFEVPAYLDGWLNKNVLFIKGLLSEYKDVNIYLENMFDRKPDMFVRICEELKDEKRFGICLDVAHAYLSNVDVGEWIEKLSPFIKHVHINDNDGINDLHQALGDGVIDYKRVFKLLNYCEVDTKILIEVSGIMKQKASLEYLKKNELL